MLERLRIYDWNYWIDFTSGGIFAACDGVYSGAIRSELREYLDDPMLPICSYSAHYRDPTTERYIDMLKEFTGYESVALFSTGSEATEAFWRVARVYTGKPGIWGGLVDPDEVGRTEPFPQPDAMHGWTLGSLVMAGRMRLAHRGMFVELGAEREGMTYDATGCAIWEPYHAPSAQFHKESPTMDRIRTNIAKHEEILFCCDEIQGGFGRTGKMFAHEWYSPAIKSQFVTIGKAQGGGLPLSALLGPKEIMEDPLIISDGHLHSTHSGNPLMCAAGIAVIEAIQKYDLIAESHRKGLILAELLKDCGVRYHAGKGLLAGLEFAGPLEADKVVQACRDKGLLTVSTGRKWVKLGPPFTITDEDLEKGAKILKEAIQEVKNELGENEANNSSGIEE